jgi:aryl-alcohol dehydrogenase-like predicted oxidoreductase
MTSLARIGLGSVQFGTDYGISNRDGRPSETEVAAILARAVATGIGYLDTAAGYGDAETLIGRHLPRDHRLKIVTKLPALTDDVVEPRHVGVVLEALHKSLERLRCAQVYGILLHNARDLAKPGWQHLLDALRQAQSRGWTSRIGVSVYDASDLALVESRFKPDIVQLPLNALDRRLTVSGWLDRLKASGIELHARALFLQGLLLMEPDTLSDFFLPARGAIAALHSRWDVAKLTPVAGCLHYVLRNAAIDAAIVGVNSVHELAQIETAVSELAVESDDGSAIEVDPVYLDPRRWPSKLQ